MPTCMKCGGHTEDGKRFVGRRCTCNGMPKTQNAVDDDFALTAFQTIEKLNKEVERLRKNVSELQHIANRKSDRATEYGKAILRRKKQNALDDKFKQALKRRDRKLYYEIVKEIEGDKNG